MTDTIATPAAILGGARARLTASATDASVTYEAGFEFIVDSGPDPDQAGVLHYDGHTLGDDSIDVWFPADAVEPVEIHVAIPEGTRVRFVRDATSGDGRARAKGFEFIIEDGPIADEDDGHLFYWGSADGGLNNVDALASDIEVSASLDDIAKEPKEFTITSTVTIEYTHVVRAGSRAEAVAELVAGDITQDWTEMGKPEVKIEPQDIAEKGYDY